MLRVIFDPDKTFVPDFAKIVPRRDKSFSLFLSDSLSLRFDNLVVATEGSPKYSDLLEIIPNLELFENALGILKSKLGLFDQHEEDRVARYFKGHSKSIFFDLEHCYRLRELFETIHFTADVDIELKGITSKFKKLSPADQRRVIAAMEDMGISYEMPSSEYKTYGDISLVKFRAKRSEYNKKGDIKLMRTGQLVGKAAFGGLIMTAGTMLCIGGGLIAKKALQVLLGLNEEVIIVEDDTSNGGNI